MGHALEDFDDALLSDKDTSWHIKDKKRRSLLTEFGEVCFSRRVYIDDCADRRILLDEVLGIRPRKYLSPGAFEALAHFGAEIPYGRAAKTCFRHCEGDVSAQTTMGTLREVGDLLEDEAAQQRHELFSLGILPQAKGSSPELFVECDGIWVALQGEDKSGVEIKAMSAYAGKEEGSRIVSVKWQTPIQL